MVSAPICSPVFCKTWRTSAIVRVAGAAAAVGTTSGFDPEPDMVAGIRRGDEGFGGKIHNSSSEEGSELIGGGGDWGTSDVSL